MEVEQSATVEAPKPSKRLEIREKEIGSYNVFVRRKDFDSHYPKEVKAEAILRISSVFVNRQPLRGFTGPEEKKYLKGLLDVSPDHADWDKYARNYWLEKRIPIGFAGVQLEIGVDENGEPLNINDFINYHFIKKHPLVAPTEEEMKKQKNKMFYIQDPKKDSHKKNAQVQVSKLADREFIKATDDIKRMRNLLQVLSSFKVHSFDDESIENMLFDIKAKDPKKFLEAATDETLDLRAEIAGFIQESVLIKVGTALVYGNDTVADTEDEAVKVFKNPKNSGLLNILRTKYKEAIR
jgi:hypothetical protein